MSMSEGSGERRDWVRHWSVPGAAVRGRWAAAKCSALNKRGEPCRAIASGGSGRCQHHGGPGKRVNEWQTARRVFMARIRPRLTEEEAQDALLWRLPWVGRVTLGDAMIAARETGDPVILLEARRAAERRFVKRLEAINWQLGRWG